MISSASTRSATSVTWQRSQNTAPCGNSALHAGQIMTPGSLLQPGTAGSFTRVVRLLLLLAQFRGRGAHHLAAQKLYFFGQPFRGAHESDFLAAPSRSFLWDKAVPLSTLAPWHLPDSSSWDPNSSGCFPHARPHRLLQAPLPSHSRVPRPGQILPEHNLSPKAAKERPLEHQAHSPLDKAREERHPAALLPSRRH